MTWQQTNPQDASYYSFLDATQKCQSLLQCTSSIRHRRGHWAWKTTELYGFIIILCKSESWENRHRSNFVPWSTGWIREPLLFYPYFVGRRSCAIAGVFINVQAGRISSLDAMLEVVSGLYNPKPQIWIAWAWDVQNGIFNHIWQPIHQTEFWRFL